MPNKNKTGPLGQGPMTGRQMGNCEGAEPILGRGFGAGQGFRRGFGRGFGRGAGRFCPRCGASGFVENQVALTKEQEKKILEAELAEIEAEKAEISKQLKELKA